MVLFFVEMEGGDQVSVLNPITLSYFGEILALYSLALLLLTRANFFKKIFYSFTWLLGTFILVLGASRGPLLTLVLISFFLVFIYFRYQRKTQLFLLKFFSATMALLGILLFWVIPKVISLDLELVRRASHLFEGKGDVSMQVRDVQWSTAWSQFLESPIIGDQFLERSTNYYPHNIYLESLMATGVIGGSIFFIIIGYSLVKIAMQFFNRDLLIIFSLLLLTAMLANFTSGSLFGSSRLWILLAFILSIKSSYAYDYKISN